MARLAHALGFGVIALSMAACGGKSNSVDTTVKKTAKADGGFNVAEFIGVDKNPPDEFAVISKQPLEMPQDFAALPAPNPGARSLRDPDPLAEARAALFGQETAPATAANARTSTSEAALLAAAGNDAPDIREQLAADEQITQNEQDQYFLDSVIPGLASLRGEDTRDLVDPNEERLRLSELQSTPRAGGTEVIGTIPTTGAAAVQPIAPAQPAPVSATVAPAAPTAATDGELIFIPPQ